jgi:hypothetical protein
MTAPATCRAQEPFDPRAILLAAILTKKAELTLELPNADPARAAAIRKDIATVDSLYELYKG